MMPHDYAPLQPYREPLRTTLLRTGTIAVVVGGVLAWRGGGLARWPMAALLVLWPSLGGHWVEVFFLNFLRPRLPIARGVQIGMRLGVWFIGGIALVLCMRMTVMALSAFQAGTWPAWWRGGLGFIGVELIAHLALQLSGRPSFCNGRG